MKSRLMKLAAIVTVLSIVLACSQLNAITTPSATETSIQGGGPRIVTGKVTYTNTFFTEGVAEPEVILEDQAGFVTRNRKFVIPV